jgi:hypothetical protein
MAEILAMLGACQYAIAILRKPAAGGSANRIYLQ